MNTVRFGDLLIGEIPRVIGTLCSLEAVREFQKLADKQCDIAEVRLDHVGLDGDWLEACHQIQRDGTPVILTLRTNAEGGQCDLSHSERLKVIGQALGHVAAVDVELKSELAGDLRDVAKQKKTSLLVSYHDFDATPSPADLQGIVSTAAKQGSVAKVSTMVKSEADIRTLQSLLGKDWGVPLCVIGMGPLGTSTRTSFPCLGSCLTYGYIDKPAAPGQLSARELVEYLRAQLPKYDEEYSRRPKKMAVA
jgi:3-dehydroquinate dehydratase I